jgi:hypothetical protein
LKSKTSSSGDSTGIGRRRTAFTIVNIETVAPIPMASEATAVETSAGLERASRSP